MTRKVTGRRARPLAERFWEKVDRSAGPTGCWPWRASERAKSGKPSQRGYGQFAVGREPLIGLPARAVAHRVAYVLTIGAIPAGRTLDHLCRNRSCVNPAHLEPVALRTNILRGDAPAARQARRTTCIRGHVFDRARRDGRRACSICARQRRAA